MFYGVVTNRQGKGEGEGATSMINLLTKRILRGAVVNGDVSAVPGIVRDLEVRGEGFC